MYTYKSFFQISVSLQAALQFCQCHSSRAFLWSTLAEKIIDTGDRTLQCHDCQPGIELVKAKKHLGLQEGESSKATFACGENMASSVPIAGILFSLKQNVNARSFIFKSFMNSGIASSTLNSEGRSVKPSGFGFYQMDY